MGNILVRKWQKGNQYRYDIIPITKRDEIE